MLLDQIVVIAVKLLALVYISMLNMTYGSSLSGIYQVCKILGHVNASAVIVMYRSILEYFSYVSKSHSQDSGTTHSSVDSAAFWTSPLGFHTRNRVKQAIN